MTVFDGFMREFEKKIHGENALANIETLAEDFFEAYEVSHAPGHLIDRLSVTEAGLAFSSGKNWSGWSDRDLWDACCDSLSGQELLALMQTWVPDKRRTAPPFATVVG